jgi:hypothetical protein
LDLERHHTFQPWVPCLKHVPEGTNPQFRPQFEPVEPHHTFQETAREIPPGVGGKSRVEDRLSPRFLASLFGPNRRPQPSKPSHELIVGCVESLQLFLTGGTGLNMTSEGIEPPGFSQTERELVKLLGIGAAWFHRKRSLLVSD